MIDLHCHILPGLDDGAPDMEAALDMARVLVGLGFTTIAPSPHYGEGPGGDVAPTKAARARTELAHALNAAKIDLHLLANAEHHLTPQLYDRMDAKVVQPIEGGDWILLELPWQEVPNVEQLLFRIQTKGYRILLAHPERTRYVDLDMISRMAERGICMQLEIGSFAQKYGRLACDRAQRIAEAGCGHVLATDLHHPNGALDFLQKGTRLFAKRYGDDILRLALVDNPGRIVANAQPKEVSPLLVNKK